MVSKGHSYRLCSLSKFSCNCRSLMVTVLKSRVITKWGMLGKFLLTNNIKWRYEVYRIEYRMNPVMSCLMTIRNMWYGVVKWMKYVNRVKP